eukprot:Hpha_TRINITY_DN14996_c1_g4::TRINITY_DN14996_c1_g4_i2::g.144607::m.144607
MQAVHLFLGVLKHNISFFFIHNDITPMPLMILSLELLSTLNTADDILAVQEQLSHRLRSTLQSPPGTIDCNGILVKDLTRLTINITQGIRSIGGNTVLFE